MRKILLAFLISGWINSNSEVYFIEPKNGDVVSNTFTVKFGLSNFGIAPAGYDIPMTGHHHLLINVNLPFSSDAFPKEEFSRYTFAPGKGEESDLSFIMPEILPVVWAKIPQVIAI